MLQLYKYYLILIIFSLLINSTISAQKYGKISDEEWYITAPDEYPEAGAVVIFDKQTIKVLKQNVKIIRHVRIKVLRSTGIDEVGDQSFAYNKKYATLRYFKGQTITPDGKKHKIESDAIFEKSSNKWITNSFSFSNITEGVILEYEYIIDKKKWYFGMPTWYFQSRIYTMKSEITISLSEGYAFDMIFKNVPEEFQEPKIEKKPIPSSTGVHLLTNYIYELNNLLPIKDEPYMSSIHDYMASAQFLMISYTYPDGDKIPFISNWQDQADGLIKHFDKYCNKDKEIKKLAKKITKELETPEEKSKAIFAYIKTNYKSTDEFTGTYFKHDNISELLTEKVGSPEGKNILLVKMHQAIGIDAWPVLISTRDNGKFEPSYPDDWQFNYIISFVQINNAWHFLDVADQYSIYGVLQPQCLTDGGLLIDGKNSQIVSMTTKPIKSSRNDITTMVIDSTGHAICSTTSVMSGYYAAEMISSYDNTTHKKFIDWFIKNPVGKHIELGDYKCAPDKYNNFRVIGSFTTNELVRHLDENLIIKTISLEFEKNPFTSENRFFPIDFTYPFVYQNIVKINVEKTPLEIHLPDDVVTDLGGIKLSRTSTVFGSTVIITNRLEVHVPLIKPENYPQVKELFEQLSTLDDEEISFVYESTQ